MRTNKLNDGRARTPGGPFWEALDGRAPLPPAGTTLGREAIEVDPEDGTIEVVFAATDEFTTPRGDVLEGFLAAMLHEVLGPAVTATLEPRQFITTLSLDSRFLAPAFPGRLVARGRVMRRNGNLAFVVAELRNPDDAVVATGTATIRVVPFGVLGGRACEAA